MTDQNVKKKLPSTFRNMVVVLTLIGLISALALGFSYNLTKDAIANVGVKKTIQGIEQVLPPFDNDPSKEQYTLATHPELIFFPAKKEGNLVGVAVKTFSDAAYNQRIWLMVGFNAQLQIHNISILDQKETPGLGTKMSESKFKDQFNGKSPQQFKIKVKKDGGAVDAISAATISSRAFCDAVDKAYLALRDKMGENK
jgi:electron transport complex protein RnfG